MVKYCKWVIITIYALHKRPNGVHYRVAQLCTWLVFKSTTDICILLVSLHFPFALTLHHSFVNGELNEVVTVDTGHHTHFM